MKIVNADRQKDFVDVLLEHAIAILVMAIIYKLVGFEATVLIYLLGIFMNTKSKPVITITTMERKLEKENEPPKNKPKERTDDNEQKNNESKNTDEAT